VVRYGFTLERNRQVANEYVVLFYFLLSGMHYTALVGTIFYKPNISKPPPIPKLHTPALIGIVFALILSGCIALLYISIRTGMRTLPLPLYKNQKKRLILNSVLFDTMGRILVKIDGTLPTKEIASHIELTVSNGLYKQKKILY
jgi:hypothetical protein